MAKIDKSIFDTGPFIHLNEVDQFKLLALFKEINIPNEVADELGHIRPNVQKMKNVLIKSLEPKNKDYTKYILEQYDIQLGEAAAISLAKQQKIGLFFTDDLGARETGTLFGLEVHGTLAIVTRSLRESSITKKDAITIISRLYDDSSLFLSRDLRDWAIKEIEKF